MEQQRLYSTICIKRRIAGDPGPPPLLNPGELAFNEVDNTLYIGTSNIASASEELSASDPRFF